jgi:hypothetical protein
VQTGLQVCGEEEPSSAGGVENYWTALGEVLLIIMERFQRSCYTVILEGPVWVMKSKSLLGASVLSFLDSKVTAGERLRVNETDIKWRQRYQTFNLLLTVLWTFAICRRK